LEFAFAPGTDVGIDLVNVRVVDEINLGQFASALVRRAAYVGRCRVSLPMSSDGHRLLEWFIGYTLKITPDVSAGTVTIDLGVSGQ